MQLDEKRLHRYGPDTTTYTLAIITDEDQASQVTLEDGQVGWRSTLRYDLMHRRVDSTTGQVSYHFEEVPPEQGGELQLISLIAEGGRGAEFSELVMFGTRLVAFDDRTGLVCEIREGHELIPRQILMTGRGDEAFKGFKSEWATLYGDELIVGSHGKVALDDTTGNRVTGREEWVKRIDRGYRITSEDWSHAYQAMRAAVGIDPRRGYLTHEAAEWHPWHRCWYFFPRKVSFEPFVEEVDERARGGNLLIAADTTFTDISVTEVGPATPDRGVSSLKVIPGHPEECVALKSQEIGETTRTYAFCFDLEGRVLSDDVLLGNYKCEGLEIV